MNIPTQAEVQCKAEALAGSYMALIKTTAESAIEIAYCEGFSEGIDTACASMEAACARMDTTHEELEGRLACAKQLLLAIDSYEFECEGGRLLLCEEWIKLKKLIS